jgi:hypothetical protein
MDHFSRLSTGKCYWICQGEVPQKVKVKIQRIFSISRELPEIVFVSKSDFQIILCGSLISFEELQRP